MAVQEFHKDIRTHLRLLARNALTESDADALYFRLDATNDPITGPVTIGAFNDNHLELQSSAPTYGWLVDTTAAGNIPLRIWRKTADVYDQVVEISNDTGRVSALYDFYVEQAQNFAATLGDKISLYDDRIGASNMYGFGIESGGYLTYRSAVEHHWYIGTIADSTSHLMRLTASYLFLRSGTGFRVYDATNADYFYASHTGSNAQFGTNSGNNLQGFAGGAGYLIQWLSADEHRFYDPTNADHFAIDVAAGGEIELAGSASTTHIYVRPTSGLFYVYRTGANSEFRVYEGSGEYTSIQGGYIDFPEASEPKAYWYGTSYYTGIESSTLYERSALYFRWYSGATPDGGSSDIMQLDTDDGLQLVDHPMHFRMGSKTADNSHVILCPQGGHLSLDASTQTGAYLIQFPAAVYAASTMFTMRVRHYNYTDGTSGDWLIGGYLYLSGAWHNTFATFLGGYYKGTPIVRFVHNGSTRQGVIIGDVGDVLEYPKWNVMDVTIGYSSQTAAGWADDWSITKITSLSGWTTYDTCYPAIGIRSGGDGTSLVYFNGPSAYANSKTNTGYLRDVTGNYGSVEARGAAGSSSSWEGYSIAGEGVFMWYSSEHRGGIYDDYANKWMFQAYTSSYAYLYYNGVATFRTAPNTGADRTSGAEVYDGNSAYRDVGFNVMPLQTQNAAYTFHESEVGYAIYHNDGSSYSWTVPADTDLPAGAMWMLVNHSAASITVAQGASATLIWQDGSAAGSAKTGSRTLAGRGVATLWKHSDHAFFIWGIGLS